MLTQNLAPVHACCSLRWFWVRNSSQEVHTRSAGGVEGYIDPLPPQSVKVRFDEPDDVRPSCAMLALKCLKVARRFGALQLSS